MKNWLNIYVLGNLLSLMTMQTVVAQSNSKIVDYAHFISEVGKHNQEYIAEQFNVGIAEAEVIAARVFPDPEFSVSATDNGQRRMRMGYEVSTELEWTVELGGKRKARIDLAKSELAMERSLLESYFQNLRADATLAYLEALKNEALFMVHQDSYDRMRDIADADSIRFRLGEIMEVEAEQSRVEAEGIWVELAQQDAEWRMAVTELNLLMGNTEQDIMLTLKGDISKLNTSYLLSELISSGIENRGDLQAALKSVNVSKRSFKLAKSERAIDLGVTLGVGGTSVVSNVVAPTPSTTTLSAGLSIPLKFSNRNKGELRALQFAVKQAENNYAYAESQIKNEVVQAWYAYEAAQKQVERYQSGIMDRSKKVLDGRVYSYQRGESSLLELLDAQRTYNEAQIGYLEALYNRAMMLVELERKAGIWNVEF